MQITNSPLPILNTDGNRSPITLPPSSTPPPPLTDAQKEALQKLRDQLKNPVTPPVVETPKKTSLIDEVV
ncbi:MULTISPECIES: hypothetical protein [Pseudomonas]|uniref:Uncharacterized protein n=2 Tax=Pseudomonas gingeri TaxID=117681 RepID=A0A7Y8CD40_9PSED|nr:MULTISPECIES: hypothetical protein [Pseudomonas]NVZ24350.1 hypothetical protein [Pseudomonas gingeri]NVZ64338.1 hypothetical protein [Pseudomonas gingeri]NVZ75931.1 hypothetical protein [Pseudomonas gingeri]NWA02207.1 hypothetical protein [Pseudomonas gingeri]NWA11332.1 hypothetical protein [Pseudomonas gingeri]